MFPLPRRRRQPIGFTSFGFTLVELLVVIAIIGILVALLLPAIQAAREAARRTQCQNNLKNLALGLHNYHDSAKTFPPAITQRPGEDPGLSVRLRANWAVLLLPYIEEQSLYDSFDLVFPARISDGTGSGEVNYDERGTELEVMLCPSDEGRNNRFTGNGTILNGANGPPGTGNWARGNYGYNGFQFWPDAWDSVDDFQPYFDNWNSGVGGVNKSNSIAKITDGTSKTIMLAEMRVGLSSVDPRGVWAMGQCSASVHCRHIWNGVNVPNDCNAGGDDLPNLGALISDIGRERLIAECMMPGTGWDSNAMGQSVVRSVHTGGVFVALADSSVRFINDFIDSGTMPNAPRTGSKIRADSPSGDPTNPNVFRVWQRLNVARDGFPVNDY